MKGKEWLLALILGLVVPCSLYRLAEVTQPDTTEPESVEATEVTVPQTESPEEPTVQVLMDAEVQDMPLEEYLTGVVLGEMPASFETEALKAQAVVARTYTLKSSKHENAAVCTDYACCQAYCSPEDYLAAGHTQEELDKVTEAVAATRGMVLTYEDKLIDATYFSCSGGRTEDALAVWGSDIPYLQAVDSPGEEDATHYIDTVQFTAAEFQTKLGVQLSGSPGSWIGAVTYTNGGGVDTIQIGNVAYSGTELRQKLDLRSTAFAITAVGDTVTVTTKGFGHRVGMSQYGADAMAVSGSTFAEILAHYYPGTKLTEF